MRYWLLKSEAEMYSIEHFKKDKKTIWTEDRNYQARNFMRDEMKPQDLFLFYHSSSEPSGVFGFGKISKTGVSDPTALDKKSEYFDPKATKENNPWICVEALFVEKFLRPITLAEIKANKKLKGILVAKRGMRLSVIPISKEHFEEILKSAKAKT